MLGAICAWDILLHPIVTVRAFGWRVFFRAVFPGRGDTFLGLLQKEGVFRATAANEPELIERCVRLEMQAGAIYRSLAERFSTPRLLHRFLLELADEEDVHADLLRVCQFFAGQGRFVEDRFRPWHDYIPLLERQMQQAVASLDQIESIDDVAQLVLQVEGSEIDAVLSAIIRSTDSPFVRHLGPFRRAVRQHIDYICVTLSALTPSAVPACRDLRAKFKQGVRRG